MFFMENYGKNVVKLSMPLDKLSEMLYTFSVFCMSKSWSAKIY